MATKRIARNISKRTGRKGTILNQFFKTLIKNKKDEKPEEPVNG